MKKILISLFVALMLIGCSSTSKPQSQDKKRLKIVTTIYPVYEFSKQVVGDLADINLLVPVGNSAHDFEPSAKDIASIEDADMLVYHGAEMEPWIEKVLSALKNKNLVVVNASEGIELVKADHQHHHHDHDEKDHDHDEKDHNHKEDSKAVSNDDHKEKVDKDHDHKDVDKNHEHKESGHHHHHHGEFDPHVWLAPLNAKAEMKNIKDKLVTLDKDNASKYEENFNKAASEFDKLHQEFVAGLKDLKHKEIVVSHEAFGYLCQAYGLVQYGVEGIIPTSEPDPSTMAEIVHFVKEHGISTVFFEELASEKVANAISKETGAKVAVLSPIETLTKEQYDKGENYFSLQRANLKALVEALSK